MNEKKPIDFVKELVWSLLMYVLYFVWCFVMLMLFHFFAFRVLELDWEVRDIAIYALVAATVLMIGRIVRLIRKRS